MVLYARRVWAVWRMRSKIADLALGVVMTMAAGLPLGAAAASSGAVTIAGKVPLSCTLAVTPTSGASNIADLSQGNSGLLVATVSENCNDPNGYSVSVAGANSTSFTGLFKDATSHASLPFSVTYAGAAVLSATVTNAAAPADAAKDVRIAYAAHPNLTGSIGYSYAETLIFAITAR
jgi:hypothetical protein